MLLSTAACELTEVITPAGEDIVVVEAVLRSDQASQRFLLHRTLNGGTMEGVPGARVSVITPDGGEVLFAEDASLTCLQWEEPDTAVEARIEVEATCYTSPEEAGHWVVVGATYELRIQTADGRQLRGRTEVPGAFSWRAPAALREPITGDPACTLPPDMVVPLVWSSSPGAWVYLAEMKILGLKAALAERGIPNAPDSLRLTGVSISEADTLLAIPTQLGVFQRGQLDQALLRELQRGFPQGVQAQVVVAALDRNLVNALRGGAFNPSGNIRISSVVGDGIGVFGSLVPLSFSLQVQDGDPGFRCTGGAG